MVSCLGEFVWGDERTRALLAGALFAVLYVLGSQVAWRIAHWLRERPTHAHIRLMRWPFWRTLARAGDLAFSAGYALLMLWGGVFPANDVGLAAPSAQDAWLWWGVIVMASALWLAVWWSVYGRSGPRTPRPGLWGDWLPRPISREARLAIWRAALIPLWGGYWGIWLAALFNLGIDRLTPFYAARLRDPHQRRWAILEAALDWLGALLFLYTGSLWLAVLGRLAVHAAVWVLSRTSRPSSLDDHSQALGGC
jgi:hypothetical protein